MKITVSQLDDRGPRLRVFFTSEFGSAWGYWEGDPPQDASEHYVEIDLPPVASMIIDRADDIDQCPSIRDRGASVIVIVGELIRDGESGASLQLDGTVLLLDDELSTFPSGSLIRLTTSSITLFPVQY